MKKSSGKRGWVIALGIVVGIIVIALVAFGVDYFANKGKVARGATVGGVAIGGLYPEDAEALLSQELGAMDTEPVTVRSGELETEFIPAEAGLSVDWQETVAQAGEISANPITRLRGLFGTFEVPVASAVDDAALSPAVERIGADLSREPADGSVELVEGEVKVNEAVNGQAPEPAALRKALSDQWLRPEGVSVDPEISEPAIDADTVRQAAEGPAAKAVSADLVLHGNEEISAIVTPSHISEFVTLRNDPEAGEIVPELDVERAQEIFGEQLAETETPMRNAQISQTGQVSPHQDGVVIDWEESFAQLPERVWGNAAREWDATYKQQPATFTTEQAQTADFSQVMGEFSTSNYSYTSGQNIAVIVNDLNGVVVAPGETFSVNSYTGPRGVAQGYVEGGTIENGRAGRAVGGGISQLATTLYNAYYFAGLEDVTHTPHSYYISRYPAGREATIYDGAIDLAFHNNMDFPVRINASIGGGTVYVAIMGERDVYNVESVSGGRWAYTSPPTLNISGPDCIASSGSQGFTTSDTRIIYDKAGNEVKRETRTTVYDPQPNVRCS